MAGAVNWLGPIPGPETMKRATYEDVLNAPENKVAEILDGELFVSPMLAPRDCVVHSRLLGTVGHALREGKAKSGLLVDSRRSPRSTSESTSWCRTSRGWRREDGAHPPRRLLLDSPCLAVRGAVARRPSASTALESSGSTPRPVSPTRGS